MSELISLIVPVYNGEKHLVQCLESITHQDYSNLDIIIINDGSIDGSASIIESYRQKDGRIRVLHKQKNEGLGAARNSALDMAVGEYLLFVDCDDWIDPNHVSDLYHLMQKTGADISICNFTKYIQDESRYVLHIRESDYYERVFSPQEWFTYQYGKGHNLSSCFTVPWVKLYKKRLFENILYATDGFGEDDKTTWKTYLVADKIAYMHRSSLVYRVNTDSMTQTAHQATVFATEPVFERLAVLGLAGFDLSREIEAYQWRANLNRDHSLKTGDMVGYKNLKFHQQIIEKYGKQ